MQQAAKLRESAQELQQQAQRKSMSRVSKRCWNHKMRATREFFTFSSHVMITLDIVMQLYLAI